MKNLEVQIEYKMNQLTELQEKRNDLDFDVNYFTGDVKFYVPVLGKIKDITFQFPIVVLERVENARFTEIAKCISPQYAYALTESLVCKTVDNEGVLTTAQEVESEMLVEAESILFIDMAQIQTLEEMSEDEKVAFISIYQNTLEAEYIVFVNASEGNIGLFNPNFSKVTPEEEEYDLSTPDGFNEFLTQQVLKQVLNTNVEMQWDRPTWEVGDNGKTLMPVVDFCTLMGNPLQGNVVGSAVVEIYKKSLIEKGIKKTSAIELQTLTPEMQELHRDQLKLYENIEEDFRSFYPYTKIAQLSLISAFHDEKEMQKSIFNHLMQEVKEYIFYTLDIPIIYTVITDESKGFQEILEKQGFKYDSLRECLYLTISDFDSDYGREIDTFGGL